MFMICVSFPFQYGLLETHNGSKYYIEPLEELHRRPADQVDDGFAVPHVIYPSDAASVNDQETKYGCGLSGKLPRLPKCFYPGKHF